MVVRNNEHQNSIANLNERLINNRALEAISRIPDPVKDLPKQDGNRRQLVSWLNTAEKAYDFFKDRVTEEQQQIYLQAIINKVEGKARDILCLKTNVETFEELKDSLQDALGDRQELST